MNMESLRSLQKRIREATGADRELDFAICKAFHLRPSWCERYIVGSVDMAPRFTSDPDGLGACVALLKEVLPGWPWSVSGHRFDNRGKSCASVHPPYGYEGPAPWPERYGHHDSPCLALLCAIISARIAELEAEQAKEKTDV